MDSDIIMCTKCSHYFIQSQNISSTLCSRMFFQDLSDDVETKMSILISNTHWRLDPEDLGEGGSQGRERGREGARGGREGEREPGEGDREPGSQGGGGEGRWGREGGRGKGRRRERMTRVKGKLITKLSLNSAM